MSSATVSYEELLERLKQALRRNGLKHTVQRELILRVIYDCDEHFSPEELHQKVQHCFPDTRVGIATIYRTLSLLESEKMVTSVSFGVSGKKYEFGMKHHHDHMICDRCGLMIEFVDETIEKRQSRIAADHRFKITGHIMQIHGLCHDCQQKD